MRKPELAGTTRYAVTAPFKRISALLWFGVPPSGGLGVERP